MLRSLLAVIIAVIVGLTTAKFIEGAGGAVLTIDADNLGQGEKASGAYQLFLALGWFVGAFTAAGLSLLLGRRWAPLGYLGAGTILFSAGITLMSFSLSWLLWPSSILACGAGGYLAMKVFNGKKEYPAPDASKEIFGD